MSHTPIEPAAPPIPRSFLEYVRSFGATDVVAAVNFPYRFLESLGALRARIAAGALGRLRFAAHTMTHGFGPVFQAASR